jgi:hypothetical protein
MALKAKEPVDSMGDDIPPAILSRRPRLLYDYFKQLFAQVTNPPLDAIREELVTSLRTTVGTEQDLFQETPRHCRQLMLDGPVLTDTRLALLRQIDQPDLRPAALSILFRMEEGGRGLERALTDLFRAAVGAVKKRGNPSEPLRSWGRRTVGTNPGLAGHGRPPPPPDSERPADPLRPGG